MTKITIPFSQQKSLCTFYLGEKNDKKIVSNHRQQLHYNTLKNDHNYNNWSRWTQTHPEMEAHGNFADDCRQQKTTKTSLLRRCPKLLFLLHRSALSDLGRFGRKKYLCWREREREGEGYGACGSSVCCWLKPEYKRVVCVCVCVCVKHCVCGECVCCKFKQLYTCEIACVCINAIRGAILWKKPTFYEFRSFIGNERWFQMQMIQI